MGISTLIRTLLSRQQFIPGSGHAGKSSVMINIYRLPLYVVLTRTALINVSSAQELEPRRWAHVPVDTNYFGVGYVKTDGDVLFDPVLRIEYTTVNINFGDR